MKINKNLSAEDLAKIKIACEIKCNCPEVAVYDSYIGYDPDYFWAHCSRRSSKDSICYRLFTDLESGCPCDHYKKTRVEIAAIISKEFGYDLP